MEFTGKCKHCSREIPEGAECSNCWEVRTRVESMPDNVVQNILLARGRDRWPYSQLALVSAELKEAIVGKEIYRDRVRDAERALEGDPQ